MKYDLTKSEIQYIFDLARTEWLDNNEVGRSTRYLIVNSYFKAITAFLTKKGYKIVKCDEE